ncbi:hypothetical protein OBK30_01375 [Empedobacter falsenii]
MSIDTEKFLEYYKVEYSEYIDSLIKEIKISEKTILYSDFTPEMRLKTKQIISSFLDKEGVKDDLVTDNLTYNLKISFMLLSLCYDINCKLDQKLIDVIIDQNSKFI